MPQQADFNQTVSGVRAELIPGVASRRVTIAAGSVFDLREPPRDAGSGLVSLVLVDREVTHLGGEDGKTPEPTTIFVRCPHEAVSILEGEPAAA
jgi:hypothetical protein